MTIYNTKGIFNNTEDSYEDLKNCLSNNYTRLCSSIQSVEINQVTTGLETDVKPVCQCQQIARC